MNGAKKSQHQENGSEGIPIVMGRARTGAAPNPTVLEGGLANRCDLLESAIQCIADGVVVVDLHGKILFNNKSAEQIVGMSSLDVSPAEWSSTYGCYLPDKFTPYPSEQLPLARAMRGEYVVDDDIFIRNARMPSGTWISVNSSPLYDEKSELCGGVITFRDVTHRRESREVVNRLSKAVERTTDGVFITDANGKIEYVNPAFEATTGYTREEVIGCRPSIMKSGRHGQVFYKELWTNILAGKVHSGTTVNKKKNGELFHAEQTITPIKDETGNLTHFVSVMRDVTDLKRAEAREIEMRLARVVQQKLYPSRAPEIAGFDVAGEAFPADSTCGDYFDYISLSDGCVCIAVGDVSGHGFGSALLMAETRAYLRSLVQSTSDLGEILRQLNTFLCHDTEDERFVTLMLVRLDPVKRSLVYVSAGHIPGYLIDASGVVKNVLGSTSMPLGIFSDAEFSSSPGQLLDEGDLLFMLTDGATESQNEDEEFFGEERILQLVAEQRRCESSQIVKNLYRTIKEFASGSPQSDDITAVVAKVLAQR